MGNIAAGWLWVAGGLVLMLLELFAPGAFMLWLGLAAIATGLLSFLLAMGFETQILVFSALALASVVVGRAVYRRAARNAPGDPGLNAGSATLIGRAFVLEEPIAAGQGRIRVDDTVWRIEADVELPAGTKVRVYEVEGSLLRVVAA